MLYLTNHPYRFENIYYDKRWNYAINGFKQLGGYLGGCLLLPGGGPALLSASATCFILGMIGKGLNSILKSPILERCSIVFIRLGIKFLIDTVYYVSCLIFKILIIAGLFFGALFPKIGAKIKALDKSYSKAFQKLLFYFSPIIVQENALKILGLLPNSSQAEITKKYRKLCLKWHPDKNFSTDAKEKFQKICEAYQALTHRFQE